MFLSRKNQFKGFMSARGRKSSQCNHVLNLAENALCATIFRDSWTILPILPRRNTTPTHGKSSRFSVVITALVCYTAAAFKLLGHICRKKLESFSLKITITTEKASDVEKSESTFLESVEPCCFIARDRRRSRRIVD